MSQQLEKYVCAMLVKYETSRKRTLTTCTWTAFFIEDSWIEASFISRIDNAVLMRRPNVSCNREIASVNYLLDKYPSALQLPRKTTATRMQRFTN